MTNKTFNIYCDESCHLEHDGIKPMVLGMVWCPMDVRMQVFKELRDLKVKHGLSQRCELKWNAVSPSKYAYYKDVMEYFFSNPDLHFRALVVEDKSLLRHDDYRQTHDEFYYKMYFDLLKVVISPSCEYNIFLDIKDTHGGRKLRKLKEVLSCSSYDFDNSIIRMVEQVDSHDVELVELADLLIGAIAYAHRGLQTSKAKLSLLQLMRERSGYSLMRSTLYREDKCNIFIWKGRK